MSEIVVVVRAGPGGHVIPVLANSEYHGASLAPNSCEYEQACRDFSSLISFVFCLHVLLFSLTLIILSFVICFVYMGEHKMVMMVMIHPRPKHLLLKNYKYKLCT